MNLDRKGFPVSWLWIGCVLFSLGAGAAECGRAIRDARRGEVPIVRVKSRLARRLQLASCLAMLSILAGLDPPDTPPEGWGLGLFLSLCAVGFVLLIALFRLVRADLEETKELARVEAMALASTLTKGDRRELTTKKGGTPEKHPPGAP